MIQEQGAHTQSESEASQSLLKTENTKDDAVSPTDTNRLPGHLPLELIIQILSNIPHDSFHQPNLYHLALVSRSWYTATIPYLYHSPRFSGKNFKLFVSTVCPSINAHVRRSALADLVRRLDMSRLVHDGSKSLTARLLGRVKAGLEEFVAPQASFAVNSLAALSKCRNLRLLDLSLVSEALALSNLFQSISRLAKLETFHFPRCSTSTPSFQGVSLGRFGHIAWPPTLQRLHLSGGIRDNTIVYFTSIPRTLTTLTVESCPNVSVAFIFTLLHNIGRQLHTLKILYHLPRLTHRDLDDILRLLPNLTELALSTDHITNAFFDRAGLIDPPHPLEMLTLDSLESVGPEALSSDAIFLAVSDRGLANLRRVRISARLGWMTTGSGREDMEDLRDLLEALEREEVERVGRERRETGVWIVPSSF